MNYLYCMNDYKLYKGAWVYQGKPHEETRLTSQQMKGLLKQGGVMVRNCYDFDCQEITSYWWIIKSKFVDISLFNKKNRKYIEKAYSLLDIGEITKERMIKEAYFVYKAAFTKYSIHTRQQSQSEFVNGILNADDNIHYWGASVKETGQLVAFVICKVYDDICEYMTSKADPSFLPKYYPLYGLYYARDEYYLNQLKLKYVISGARTITEHSNIQTFLQDKFYFRKAYCKLWIKYVWWLKIIVDILYPFRNIISINSIKAVLNQEAMVRENRLKS